MTSPAAAAVAVGDNNSTTPIEDLRFRARMQVYRAVEKLLLPRKRAYLEAVDQVPLLCEIESDPLAFLRRCDYNVAAAAERLCLYWRERVDLFQERAHLPLNLLGDGALSEDDVISLMAGWPAVLPKTKTGQHVLYSDRRQNHPTATPESRLRCLFYASHICALDERAQTEGIIVLGLAVIPRAPKIDRAFVDRALFLSREVFPVKAFFHHFNLAAAPERRYEVQDTTTRVVEEHLRLGSKLDDVEVHFERDSSKENFLAALYELGFSDEGIPVSLGGSWTFVSHTEWCHARVRTERQLQLVVVHSPAAADRAKNNTHKTPTTTTTRDANKKKDAAARQRERNVIYSRRKRERRRKEERDLEEAKSQLTSEKEYLLAERKRLEELLSQAQELAKAAADDDDREGDKKPSVVEERQSGE